jgi:hypothetical protein
MTDKVTPKQARGIMALLTEPTITAAASKAGVTPKTIYKWLREPRFKAALSEAQAGEIDAAARRLSGLQSKAIGALVKVFERAEEQDALNIAELFTEETYTLKDSEATATRLVLDIEKVKANGRLIKKLKTSKGELEVEGYDALTAMSLKQRAAESILNHMLKLTDIAEIMKRIEALEARGK